MKNGKAEDTAQATCPKTIFYLFWHPSIPRAVLSQDWIFVLWPERIYSCVLIILSAQENGVGADKEVAYTFNPITDNRLSNTPQVCSHRTHLLTVQTVLYPRWKACTGDLLCWWALNLNI